MENESYGHYVFLSEDKEKNLKNMDPRVKKTMEILLAQSLAQSKREIESEIYQKFVDNFSNQKPDA